MSRGVKESTDFLETSPLAAAPQFEERKPTVTVLP
jgi:hypothetical protein